VVRSFQFRHNQARHRGQRNKVLASLLTGEAVVFALSFSVSSGWPSLREIDRHIAFREWVVTGWVASM